MRKLILICTLSVCSSAATSVVLPAGKTGATTFPLVAAGDGWRIEGRIHNRTIVAGASNGFAFNFVAGQNGLGVTYYTLGQDFVTCYVANNEMRYTSTPPSDFEFRIQRSPTGARRCEIWDIGAPGAPSVYSVGGSVSTAQITAGAFNIGHTFANFSFAYLRWFSTTVPLGSTPPGLSTTPGDELNFEFEGSTAAELGADTSGKGRNITWSGGIAPATMTTPEYPPVCVIGSTKIFRTGEPLIADGSESWSPSGGPVTYRWAVTAYPSSTAPVIVDNDASSATVRLVNTVFGQYTLSLTVTTAGGSTTCSVTHGVVASTTGGIVIYPPGTPSAISYLIGPLIAPDKSPTPWFDVAATSAADFFDGRWGVTAGAVDRECYWDGCPEKWGPGTVAMAQSDTSLSPNPGVKVQCTTPGTCGFRSRVCNASGVVISGATMFINYPAWEGGGAALVQGGYAAGVPISTGESGWLSAAVASCPSDDEVTLTGALNVGAPKGTAMTVRNWSFFTGTPSPVLAWSSANPSAVDFYDSGLAFYSMYYRTGLTKYLTRARYIADLHYGNAMSLNKGLPYRAGEDYTHDGQQQAFRDINLTSVVIRALDGKPEYWTGIARVCDVSNGGGGGAGDREAGYALAFEAMCALADPDSGRKATWLSRLNTNIAGFQNYSCGGTPGRVCHGRNFGQWVIDTWAVCPGNPPGVRSREVVCPGGDHYKPGWRIRLTAGSETAEMIAGDLTFPATHPTWPNQPIVFGHDSTAGPACVATGSGTTFSCNTSPTTTSYTTGMQILLTIPTTALNPTIDIDGLGAKNIRSSTGASLSVVGGTNYSLRYTGTQFQEMAVLTSVYIRMTPDLGYAVGDDIGRAFYWPEKVDATHFKLKQFSRVADRASVPYENWPKATGDYHFQIDANAFVGSRTQPFMLGIIMRGLDIAYEATRVAGTPNATALTLLSDAAKFLVDYGYDHLGGGLYFARVTPGCEAESGYGVMAPTIPALPGSCFSDTAGSRGLTPEIIGAMGAAYLRETNSTRKTNIRNAMVRWWGHTYGKPGYTCATDYAPHCGDGYYLTLLEETYSLGETNYDVDKYIGFALGFGGSFAWPSAEQHTEYPRAVTSKTMSLLFRMADIPTATSVRVQLQDPFGTLLTPVDCAASPCSITVPDKQIGNYLAKLNYRNASGVTLSAGSFQRFANAE